MTRWSVASWHLLFHWAPVPEVQDELRRLLAPIAHIRMPDYDPRRYDDGLHRVVLTGSRQARAAAEVERDCREQWRNLNQPPEGDWFETAEGRHWLAYPAGMPSTPPKTRVPQLHDGHFSVDTIRSLDPSDQEALWDWLHVALWDPPPAGLRPREVLANPAVAIYAEGWGREGDVGVVCEADGKDGGADRELKKGAKGALRKCRTHPFRVGTPLRYLRAPGGQATRSSRW